MNNGNPKAGATFASLHAMIAQSHMDEYGTSREELSAVSEKNHYHASLNPMAQFQFQVSGEAVSNSGIVSSPLRMLDCAPNSDGAAAVVLCATDKAKKFKKKAIRIIGSGQASDTLSLHHRKYLNRLPAIGIAARRAFKSCGKKTRDLDLIEVHDNFTISEIIALEEIGIFKRGKAASMGLKGETRLGGKIAVNTSGGLKARGHAPGATGIAQVVEIVQQLRGEAGERQIKDAKIRTGGKSWRYSSNCRSTHTGGGLMSVPRFWRELDSRYNLVGSHCKITNTYHYPKRSFNPEAGRDSIGNMEDYQFKGNGKVINSTVVHQAQTGYEMFGPYCIAIIELEEGPRITSQVVDCDPEIVKPGNESQICVQKTWRR
jgi:uncharacterized OB-fold protein